MVSYNVILSPNALLQLSRYLHYIHYTLGNEQAARSVWQDAMDTRDRLTVIAGSMKFCSHSQLKQLGYRIINFKRHHYSMLYRIVETNVYVDAIYHQLQDYESTFADELDNN